MQAPIVGEPSGANPSYKPVAPTPQLTTKLKLAPLAKLERLRPGALSKLGHSPAAGHTPVPEAAQLSTLQALRPALGVSKARAPSAAAGPLLVKVTVYWVVLPATKLVVPLSLLTDSEALQLTEVATMLDVLLAVWLSDGVSEMLAVLLALPQLLVPKLTMAVIVGKAELLARG